MEKILKDISYGNDPKQKLDILIPKKKAAHAIIYIHGGAFFTGNKAQYPSFLADYSTNNIIASIDYRLTDKYNTICMEDILSDINSALGKIEELANSNGVTIKGFILTGHSAGGQIGLLYGYKYYKNKKITTCISLSGPTDFTDDIGWSSMTMWGKNTEERLSFLSQMGSRLTGHKIQLTRPDWTKQKDYSIFKKYIEEISPITYITKPETIPPTLLVHARADNQVPYSNALRLKTALDFTSIPHKLITPAGSGNNHMLGGECYTENSPILFYNQIWLKELKKWVEIFLQIDRCDLNAIGER